MAATGWLLAHDVEAMARETMTFARHDPAQAGTRRGAVQTVAWLRVLVLDEFDPALMN